MGALTSLISGLASGEAVAIVQRARWAAIAYAIAALAALCGIGFIVGAGYIWASRQYGALPAALAFGIGFLVLAGLIVLLFRLSAGRRARKRAKQRRDDVAAVGAAAAFAMLPSLLRGKSGLGPLLLPALALAAYAIYRENSGPNEDKPDE